MEDLFKPGLLCVVNGYSDLAFSGEAKQFINKECVIVKRCKGGLIQVALLSNTKKMLSLSQKNLTIKPDQPSQES